MLESIKNAIAISWRRNAAYAERLVADVPDDDLCRQPIPSCLLNHPAWILAHLTLYGDVAATILRGDKLVDPIDHEHGANSQPQVERTAYPAKELLLSQFLEVHRRAEQALTAATTEQLLQQSPLPRWQAMHPRILDLVVMMMIKHESGHLGQLSAWRRAMHLAPVSM